MDDLIDLYRTLHPKASEYTFFSSAPRMFSRIDHSFTQRANVSTFKKTEIISNIFSFQSGTKLKMKYKKKTGKLTKVWKLKEKKYVDIVTGDNGNMTY